MKRVLLPLDSRPVCYDLPLLFDPALIVPPLSIMDYYHTPSEFEKISEFLDDACRNVDEVIICVEQLVYGGLIASRNSSISMDEALKRLAFIRQLKSKHPDLRVILASVIMRDTIGAMSKEDEVYWQLISEYSKYSYLKKSDDIKRLESKIPSCVLNKYMSARKLNRDINLAVVGLLRDNIASAAVFLQEDTKPESLPKLDQEEIRRHAYGLNYFMHNGTDECACELAALDCPPSSVCIKYLSGNESQILRYEDNPFKKNLESHLTLCNLEIDEHSQNVLFIHLPKEYQFDHQPEVYDISSDYSDSELDKIACKISDNVSEGKNCYLLDLNWANGGDERLVKCLSGYIPLKYLAGYSAWNTASNSLGVLLAQIRSGKVGGIFLKRALLDDYLYQAVIRSEFTSLVDDRWNIKDKKHAGSILQNLFKKHEEKLFRMYGEIFSYTVALRWNRTFEIEVEVKA